MNEKQKIFAAGTVVGAATGFGMASFLLMLGALYMAPQLLDTMKQEAMVLHPPSQVQSAPLLFENPLFPMESATDRSAGETQAVRVIHVRAVQGGGIGGPVTESGIPLPNVPNVPVLPPQPMQTDETSLPSPAIVASAPEMLSGVSSSAISEPSTAPVLVKPAQKEAAASESAEERIVFLGEPEKSSQTP